MHRLIALVAALAALAVVPAASATTIRVNWNEKYQFSDGSMSFHVSRIVVTGFAWKVTASYTNHSTKTLKVTRGYVPIPRLTGTGIWYPSPPAPGTVGGGTVFRAAHAKPAFPSLLRPGKTWAGTFGGYGELPHHKLIFIVFGYFTPIDNPQAGFNYTLNHDFRL